jgi:hypothetical protein
MVKDVGRRITVTSSPVARVVNHSPCSSGGTALGARVVVVASVVLVVGSTVVDGAPVEVTGKDVVTELASPQAARAISRRLMNQIRTVKPPFSAEAHQTRLTQVSNAQTVCLSRASF